MSQDIHLRCNEKITYQSVIEDNAKNPLLQKLWDDANIRLSIEEEPYLDHEYYYDNVRYLFPKFRTNFYLSYTEFVTFPGCDMKWYTPEEHKRVYLTLKWFVEYLRQLVKRVGEVWYTENWVTDEGLTVDNIKIVTYNVNEEICFMRNEKDEFAFRGDTFYRFVDGDEQD